MPFPTLSEYETLLYGLTNQHPQVQESTLRLYTVSVLSAIVEGELRLTNGLTLQVLEIINFKSRRIQKYSYTVLRGQEKLCWYDPQPHPEIESLKSTFPHHRHEPPNIKQNRQPAPGISFDAPNLHTLIQDCVELGESLGK